MAKNLATTEISFVSMLFSSEDWVQHNLKAFQRPFKHTPQHTSTQSLHRNNLRERISKASKQSILFNNNLGSLTVYPLNTCLVNSTCLLLLNESPPEYFHHTQSNTA